MSFEKDRKNKKIRVMVEKWKRGVFGKEKERNL
jgi:hypothetical protein